MHDPVIAKQSNETIGTTQTWKLIHIHQTKARTCVTEDKSRDFKTKAQINASAAAKEYTNSGTAQTSR